MTTDSVGRATRPETHRVPLLHGRPGDPALLVGTDTDTGAGTVTVTYAELAAAISERRSQLDARQGSGRGLVLLEAGPDVRTVVTYLAALDGGHPVLVTEPGTAHRGGEIMTTYRPDTVSRVGGLDELTGRRGPDLHPDLAVLLSTSGSTASPRLVRLSTENVVSNAAQIAHLLGLRPEDRGITSLPLHYSYGLSVLTSHLSAGASVVLSDHSVAEESFWELVARAGVTNVAGVPHTFEILDAVGFEDRELPSLRLLTCAGGKLDPDRVVRFAELGRRRGWDLFVMYGQTEATARIAYLPPGEALDHPGAVGRAVPGGRVWVEPTAEPTPDAPSGECQRDGEICYAGPNVMMGYATCPDDLARGPEISVLRTGDRGHVDGDGLLHVTGRTDRVAKLLGLRLDLSRLQNDLSHPGRLVYVVATSTRLVGFVSDPRVVTDTADRLAALSGLPPGLVAVHQLCDVPRRPNGKPDLAALTALAQTHQDARDRPTDVGVADLYTAVLGRARVRGDDTFISLGGDSLSFVEISTRLSAKLGELPRDWPSRSVDELAQLPTRRRRFTVPVEVGALLRAVAITLVVLTHTDLILIPGGAHALLAVAGYNLARFALAGSGTRDRVRRLGATAAAVAVPASAWILLTGQLTGDYRPSTALYLNWLVGDSAWTLDWQFWFLEALVWAYLAVAALLLVPTLSTRQRRRPFGAAMLVVAVTLAMRYGLVGVQADDTEKYSLAVVWWVMALGWAAAEARTTTQRVLVGLTSAAAAYGFFGDLLREAIVVGTIAALMWARPVLMPRVVAGAARWVAAASLWIYLTHWQVYPGLEEAGHPALAVVASLVVGVACWAAYSRVANLEVFGRLRQTGPAGSRAVSDERSGRVPW